MGKMLTAKEASGILQISESKAYTYIRILNQELADKGFMTARGRVPKKYFFERFGIEEDKE